jgi:hypothetical protein
MLRKEGLRKEGLRKEGIRKEGLRKEGPGKQALRIRKRKHKVCRLGNGLVLKVVRG